MTRFFIIFFFAVKLPMVEYDYDTHIYKVNEEVHNYISVKTTPVATSFIIFDEYDKKLLFRIIS